MKNLDYIPESLKKSIHRAQYYIDKLRMLRIHVYWGARLELADPDMTFI